MTLTAQSAESDPARRKATEQLNWALALRLAGEFQGFARDLHDEATIALAGTAVTPALESVLQEHLR